MTPRLSIKPADNNDERTHAGTRSHRRKPAGLKVRYSIMMATFLLVALAASFAVNKALESKQQSGSVAIQARVARDLAAANLVVAHRVAALVARVSADEQRTCTIQAQGLPAGHQLAASMRDIHTLLTLPPSPGAPPVPPHIERIVKSLNGHLAAFLHAEALQPHQRTC